MLKVTPILYHGMTPRNPEALLKNGWRLPDTTGKQR